MHILLLQSSDKMQQINVRGLLSFVLLVKPLHKVICAFSVTDGCH